MLFILVASSVLIVNEGKQVYTDEVVRFYAKTFSSEHFKITQCENDKPFYKYRGGQNTTVHMFIESDLEVTTLKQCILGPRIFKPPWSVYRVNSTHQHVEISMYGRAINRDVSDLNCYVVLGAGNDSMELQCSARFSNVDGSQLTTFAYVSGFIKAKIFVDLNRTSVIKDIEIWDNSSLLVDCVALDNGYKHAIFKKNKYGNTRVVGRNWSGWYLFIMNRDSDIVEFGCSETRTNKKYEAAVRLTFIETEYSANKQINNKFAILKTWMIVLICISSLVVVAVVVAWILWRSKVLRKRKERDPMPLPELSRPESLASGHYEHIYDLPDKNLINKKVLKNMLKERISPNPPTPSPSENMPSKRFNTSPRVLSGNDNLPEDSQISPSDLYLLHIDSEGYQIPVKPQLFPIISE